MRHYPKLISFYLILILSLSAKILAQDEQVSIMGIEPNGGLTSGETRVLVRLNNFKQELISTYPHPSCRFGSAKYTVAGTYTKCTPKPRKPGERQPSTLEKTEICIQCEDSPQHSDEIIPFTVSLLGDFTDTLNSIPYRYYKEPKITYISPRSGPKDGNTKVDVYGEGFLNFDQNLRCGFGSKEVKGVFINENHIQCISPFSSIVQRKIEFSISLNNQQNTKEDIPYVYYENPTIYSIEPINRGPDSGGSVIRLRGANFNPFKELRDLKLENETFCQFENLGKRTAKVLSSTEMECVTPPSYEKLEVAVEVTLNDQQYSDDNVLFYYYHPPYTYYISPKIGPVSGGTVIRVMGGNLEDTGIVKCKFGDKLGKGRFISKNELECISPPVEKPCVVPLRVATREDEYSSGLNTKFTYYDIPEIYFIEPACGPDTGFTQITVYGENFPVGYSNSVKCLFNGKIKTNATVINYNELKCDSPPLPTQPGSEEKSISSYEVTILVDETESGPAQTFYYYKSPIISGISPIMGGVEGDTTVKIMGKGFDQPGACKVTTRFATYIARPIKVEDDYILVKSPKANYTGSVVVQVSLNGQQFEKDITYNYRDQQNTFYYYKCPVIAAIHPDEGPSAGGNEISLYGVGFLEPFFALDKENNLRYDLYGGDLEKEIFYRFVDWEEDGITYGEIQKVSLEDASSQKIVLKSPSILESINYRGRNNIKTMIQLSYDGENFCDYEDIVYTFFNLPNIVNIHPKYAPLEQKNQEIIVTFDSLNCKEKDDCSKGIKCRFKSTKEDSNKEFIMEGEYIENNKIKCDAPNVNIPEEFNVEASINGGDDYTNNNFNYTYYDPFVLKVEPQMLRDNGNTEIKITGYGFANTGDNIEVLFGDSDKETLNCNQGKCLSSSVEYIDSTCINAKSIPRQKVIDKSTGRPIVNYKKFPVEVAIYNHDFTNNKVSVFYYEDPKIIQDIDSQEAEALHLTPSSKAILKDSLVDSIPCNIDTFIPIPVDGSEIERHLDEIDNYANYTCKFEVNGKEKITNGVFTKFPLNNTVHNLFLCQSPNFINEVSKNGKIHISLNGYDFSEDYFQIEFTTPVNVYKIVPPCGPIEGGTRVNIYGTGFEDSKKAVFKWGPQNLVPMSSNSFLENANEQTSQEIMYQIQHMVALNNPDNEDKRIELMKALEDVEVQKITVRAPPAPNDNIQLKTKGGLDYISVSKTNLLPLDDFLQQYYANNFIHTNFEYYYYKQIYIDSYYPSSSMSQGGGKVLVIGAWFQNKPHYGVKPYCKFGDKIVEGEYLSTVRIICDIPPSDKEFNRVTFSVSLNGEDWVDAEKPFRYYGDFKNAKFNLIEPNSGPTTGGTHVKVYGTGFTAIFDENELLCQFEPVDTVEEIDEEGNKVYKEVRNKMEPRNVPARLSSPSRDRNQKEAEERDKADNNEIDEEGSYIECNAPGGWPRGTKTNVKIAFDGQTFLDTKQNFFFYQIDEIFPSAGPNTGEGNIKFIGGGFEPEGNITFVFNDENYKPINVTEKEIEVDIPSMPENYVGYVDLGLILNKKDLIEFKDGFYYYIQPTIESVYPLTGPSTGNTIFHVFGKNFRDDFRGANLKCKVGSCIGEGKVVSNTEMKCFFDNLPVEHIEFTEKEDGTKVKSGNPIQIALNGVSFTKKNSSLAINTYSVEEISPVSGPIETGTIIVVKGSGFSKSDNIRCRFGVPGYFAYTEGTFISYNKITCPSPKDFALPQGGALPFSVPFSIAFNDDEFNPWTSTSHMFTFYTTPDVSLIEPKEINTTAITPVHLKADILEKQFFSMPLASVIEDEYQVLNKEGEPTREVRKSIAEQKFVCRFGKYGVTEAEILNKTDIICLSPKFNAEDDDIVYEEIPIEISPNGVDFVEAGMITLKGQKAKSAGFMYSVLAILGVLFLACIAALVAWTVIKGRGFDIPNEPHTVGGKQLKYLQEENIEGKGTGLDS